MTRPNMEPKPTEQSDPERERIVAATAWFSVLAHAWYTGDVDEASRARQELDALGFVVRCPRRGRKGAAR